MIFRRYWNQFRAWSDRCGCPRVMGALVFAGLLAACGQVSYTADEHIDRARQAHAEGDLRTAIIEIKNALQQDASRAEARRLLGLYNLEVGDVVAAESELTRALELGGDRDGIRLPLTRAWLLQGETDRVLEETRLADSFTEAQWPEALALRGTAFLYQGEVEQASTLFHETLQLEPNQADALMGLARIERFDGAVDAARSRLEQVLADNPQFDQAWELLGDIERQVNNLQEAETAYTQALEATHQPFSPRLKRTLTRIGLDDLDAASRDVQALERNFAQHPGVSYVRGLIAFNQERYGDARVDFEEALSREANYVPALFYLGITHIRLGNQRQAEQHLRRHLTRAPDSLQATSYLIGLLTQQGRFAEARHLLEESVPRFNGQHAGLDAIRTRLAFAAGDDQQGLVLLAGLVESRPDSADLQELLGTELIRQGDREQGLAALRLAATMDNAPRPADHVVILSELEAGNFGAALEAARKLRDKQPESAEPWNFIGAALMGLGRIDEAREAFEKGLEIEPDHASTAMNLGNLELRVGRRDAARDAFASIQHHHPGHPASVMRLVGLAMQQNDSISAIRWLEQAITHHPEATEPHLSLARIQLETGQGEAAAQILEQALAHHPDNPQMLFALAEIQERIGQHRSAADTLGKLAQLRPDAVEVQLRLARNLTATGDQSASRNALRRVLEIEPGHIPARIGLVRQLSLAGEIEEARSFFEPLAEEETDRVDVMAQQAWFDFYDEQYERAAQGYREVLQREQRRHWVFEGYLAQLQAERFNDAMNTLRNWLVERPDDDEVRHRLGSELLRSGDEQAAIAVFEEQLSRRPSDVAALNNLAWLLRERDTDQALEYAEQANRLAPETPGIMATLGVVLLQHQDYERANELLAKAYAMAPDSAGIGFNLARSYEAMGESTRARTVLEQILNWTEPFPEREQATELLMNLERAQ